MVRLHAGAFVAAPTAKLGVRALFHSVLDCLDGPKAPSRLCLMAASLTREVLAESDLRKYVQQQMSMLAEGMIARLAADKESGLLPPDFDPRIVVPIIITYLQGAGKSTAFPESGFGVDFFNADDRAAALNDGSYLNIPRNVRSHVNTRFESFVLDHIARRSSCAFETTLRSGITFDQAARARKAGFLMEMRYVVLRDFSSHLERVKMRADAGGHSAPESVLRPSMRQASGTCRGRFGRWVLCTFTTTALGDSCPPCCCRPRAGEVVYLAEDIPHWLAKALG